MFVWFLTVSVWPWCKTITLSCTLDTIHVQSIFWLIILYFCHRCRCLDLFPIRRGIHHLSSLHWLLAERRKKHRRGGGEQVSTAGCGIHRNGEKGRWRGSVKRLVIFYQGPWWSCQAGVYVSQLDDNVAWHLWNERRVAMAKCAEGQSLQGPK